MKKLVFILVFLLMANSSFAQLEDDDPSVLGLEIEKLLNLGSGILATALFALTWLAYKKTGNKRLVYVSMAFLLFAAKGFLTSLELFSIEFSWIDPVASFLNFAILLAFFFGIVKK